MSKLRLSSRIFALLAVLALLSMVTAAQDAMTPSVTVSDQVVTGSTVTIDSVVAAEDGFIVIHTDNGGAPGPVIGAAAVSAGENNAVWVSIDTAAATPVLYAMLHLDTGEAGVYEFGTVEGADGPVIVDGAPVTPSFNVSILNVADQLLDGNVFVAGTVTVAAPSWLVVHEGDASSFGPVLGATFVEAGTTANVAVELDGESQVLWPMLHVDTGEAGVYEFGTVEGADGPIAANGVVATAPVWTVPHMRVDAQVLIHGDSMEMEMMDAPTLVAKSVLSEGDGWLVIHANNEGNPGPVLGFAALAPGLNTNVSVELDPQGLTPVVFPMLHVDTGEVGTYEFGAVEGADGPVRVDDTVVVFPVNVAPFIDYANASMDGDNVVIKAAMIDAAGWLVIHSDNEGAPGPVLGQTYLTAGYHSDIAVNLGGAMPANVFPMLHYDTGEAGVYEFGSVEGADLPVFVNGNVVVGPVAIDSGM